MITFEELEKIDLSCPKNVFEKAEPKTFWELLNEAAERFEIEND